MSKLSGFIGGAVKGAVGGVIKGAIYGAIAVGAIYGLAAMGAFLPAVAATGASAGFLHGAAATVAQWVGLAATTPITTAALGTAGFAAVVTPLVATGAAIFGGLKALTGGLGGYSAASRQEAAVANAQRSVAQAQKAVNVALAPQQPAQGQGSRPSFLTEILKSEQPSADRDSFAQQIAAEQAAAAQASRAV